MGSSEPGATGVSYTVNFDVGSTHDLQGIVVDFCDDTPLIGASTCTGTPGTDVPDLSASPTVSLTSGGGTWTAGQLNTNRTLTLSHTGAANSQTAGNQVTFTISGVTNPSSTGSFYTRIYTYTADTAPASYTFATPGACKSVV